MSNGRQAVRLHRTFEADIDRVFRAFTDLNAFQLYSATNGGKNVKIADHLIVRDGQLVSSEVVVDGAAFMAFMAG